jgi:antiphage defense system Thoeris ThsA-like protein
VLEVPALNETELHRAIVVVDVAGFTDPARTVVHQAAVHEGLYTVLEAAFTEAGIDLAGCTVEDRGDGALILIPPEVPKSVLAVHLPEGLLRALRRYNAVHSAQAAVKLRVALHAGEVRHDSQGAVSQAINLAFRLLDAGAARVALRRTASVLVLIASDQFYQDVISQDPAAAPLEYQRISVAVKQTVAQAWLRIPMVGDSPDDSSPRRRRRTIWTVRGAVSLGRIAVHLVLAFGALSAIVSAVDIVFGSTIRGSWTTTAVLLASSLGWGLIGSQLRRGVRRTFKHPATRIQVVVGNLFDQPGQLVIGFTDTFDTDTTDDRIINMRSLQGQLLHRLYGGERDRLDRDLTEALSGQTPHIVESVTDKRIGKRERYRVGTVAVLPVGRTRVYCSAYSVMGNDLVARSTIDDLWTSLGLLWTAVAEHGQLAALAMPIVGSELARIDLLDRENLLKLIMLSYIIRSRQSLFCKELTVVVHPNDLAEVDMTQIAAFLHRL